MEIKLPEFSRGRRPTHYHIKPSVYLIVILEGLVVVPLHVEGPGQLVTTLSLHGLHLSTVEGMQS